MGKCMKCGKDSFLFKNFKLKDGEICKKYSKRDENNKVHCYECPLVLNLRFCICKANISKKDWDENWS